MHIWLQEWVLSLSVLLHQCYVPKSHHGLALTEFNETLTKGHAAAAKEAVLLELEIPCSAAGTKWQTPAHSYSLTKQSHYRSDSTQKIGKGLGTCWFGSHQERKECKNTYALLLGNSFVLVNKIVLNGNNEQRKELTGFLQASQEQHKRAKLQSLPASYWAALFVQCLVRRNSIHLIHQPLWNRYSSGCSTSF